MLKKMTKSVGLALVVVAILAANVSLANANQVTAKASVPKLVGTDPAGDWGDPAMAPLASQFGQDLTEARIGLQGETLLFVMQVAGIGSAELASQNTYGWIFTVDSEAEEGRWHQLTNVDAVGPDALQFILSSCAEQTPTYYPGGTETGGVVCEDLATVDGKIDAAAATLEIPIDIGAFATQPRIINSGAILEATCPTTVTTNGTGTPSDSLVTTKAFSVRRSTTP